MARTGKEDKIVAKLVKGKLDLDKYRVLLRT